MGKLFAFVVLCILCVLCVVEICFLYKYFSVFNGGISSDIPNWSLFAEILNGVVMALLTSVNIWIFYRISIVIDGSNKKRNIEQRLFESQKILTDMRIRQYEELSRLANQFKVGIIKEQEDPQLFEQLKRQLMSMDDSWLFKTDQIAEPSFLHGVIESFLETYNTSNKEDKVKRLAYICIITECYIVTQLHRNKDLGDYIRDPKHKEFIDSTLVCFDQLVQEVLQEINVPTTK